MRFRRHVCFSDTFLFFFVCERSATGRELGGPRCFLERVCVCMCVCLSNHRKCSVAGWLEWLGGSDGRGVAWRGRGAVRASLWSAWGGGCSVVFLSSREGKSYIYLSMYLATGHCWQGDAMRCDAYYPSHSRLPSCLPSHLPCLVSALLPPFFLFSFLFFCSLLPDDIRISTVGYSASCVASAFAIYLYHRAGLVRFWRRNDDDDDDGAHSHGIT